MNKQKLQKNRIKTIISSGTLLLLVAAFLFSSALSSSVLADRFDEQIGQLRNENGAINQNIGNLQVQAASFEDTIRKLQAEINSLQASINVGLAEQQSLEAQIVQAQKELDENKRLLGLSIRAMYLEGEISTLEMLASSNDLSDFLNKQEYRSAVQDKIKITLDRITVLKLELKSKKEKVEALLSSLQAQRVQVDSRRSEQARLLALNASERATLDSQIKGNNSKISELQQAQVLENARLFGGSVPRGIPGGGGYSYGDAVCLWPGYADPPCGQYDWGYPSANSPRDLYDQWGYGYRNCTSWVGFKLAQAGKTGFTHLGNAKQWPNGVPSSWKSYGGGARAGDAAVSTGGYYGHVMYVEAVEGNTAYVSDYNFGGDGYYRGARPVSQSSLVFIHFP